VLDFLRTKTAEDPRLATLLAHAVSKIEAMGTDETVREYLAKANDNTGRYSGEYRDYDTVSAPSEFLLMPALDDIIGVAVEVGFDGSVDHAFTVRQAVARAKGLSAQESLEALPAFIQCISKKGGATVIPLDWQRDLLPWRRSSIAAFATTGQVVREDGGKAVPDHFQLLYEISVWGRLRVEGTQGQWGYYRFHLPGLIPKQHTPAELRPVADSALVAGLKYGRTEDELRFLFHFGPTKTLGFLDTLGFFEKRRYRKHPAMPMLQRLMNATPEEREADRLDLIASRFAAIGPKNDVTYRLRSGREERGVARFIPELMQHRVTEGWSSTEQHPGTFHGLFRYAPDKNEMWAVLGSLRSESAAAKIFDDGFSHPPGVRVLRDVADASLRWRVPEWQGHAGFGYGLEREGEAQRMKLTVEFGLDASGKAEEGAERISFAPDTSSDTFKRLEQATREPRPDFGFATLLMLRGLVSEHAPDHLSTLNQHIARYLDDFAKGIKQPTPKHQLSIEDYLKQHHPGVIEAMGTLRETIKV
jgi:hypothetical protein